MGLLRGLLVGTLSVAALEAVLSSSQATGRLGGIGTDAGRVIARVVSPDLPALGPAGAAGAAAEPSAATAATTVTVQPVALVSTKAKAPAPIVRNV